MHLYLMPELRVRQPRIRYATSPFDTNLCVEQYPTLGHTSHHHTDIAGANAAGWSSILVHTGVYNPADGPPTHKPTHEVDNAEAAVQWAIAREATRVA